MNNAAGCLLSQLIVVYLLVLPAHTIVAQTTASIVVYDMKVSLPAPAANHDSIVTYYNALRLGPALYDYLSAIDPSHAQLAPRILSPFAQLSESAALANPGALAQLEAGTLFGPMEGGNVPDYYLKGTVQPGAPGAPPAVAIQLVTGTGQEIIAAGQSALSASMSGASAAAAAAAMALIQPAYETIHSFETTKRNSGSPYAIGPALVLKSSKTSLDFHENAIIHLTLTDADGTPLKNRTVTFTVTGGTLDRRSVTTDAQGTQDLVFTAGDTPDIAVIQPFFSYTRPCGKPGETNFEPLGLQIKKPADAWYVQAKSSFSESVQEEGHSSVGGIAGQFSSEAGSGTTISMLAWVKAIAIPYLPNDFINDPAPVSMKLAGGFYDFLRTRNMTTIPGAGELKSETGHTLSGTIVNPTDPEVNISIGEGTYSIDAVVEAVQNGNTYRSEDNWSPFSGREYSSSSETVDPTTPLDFSALENTSDTAYTLTTSEPSTGTHTVTTVVQKCSWKNKVFTLDYQEHMVETAYLDGAGGTGSRSKSRVQDHTITMFMYYNAQPNAVNTDGAIDLPVSYALGQNYPNPFNPSTRIPYSLPASGAVTIRVYDVMGRAVATLIEREMPAGDHSLAFDAGSLASGVYLYRMTARHGGAVFTDTKRFIVMK